MAVLSCPLCCNEIFSNPFELKHHLNKILEDILCTLCNEKFKYISEFILHLSNCEADGTGIYQAEEVSSDSEELESTNDFLTKRSRMTTVGNDIFNVSDSTSVNIIIHEEECYKDIYTSLGLNSEENKNVDLEENQNEEGVKTDIEEISLKNTGDQVKNLFTCSFCDVSFSSIRDHISTFHENEDVLVDVGVELKMNQQNSVQECMHTIQKHWQMSDVGYYFTDSNKREKGINAYVNKNNDWPNDLKVYPLITYVSTQNIFNSETKNKSSLIIKNMSSLYKGCRVRFVVVQGDNNRPKLEEVPFFEIPFDNIYPTLELNTDILYGIKTTYLVLWHCILCNKNSHSWEKLSHHECNNWFACSICDAKFSQEEDIISHLAVHDKSEKWLYCIICQKFIIAKEYVSHIQLHVNMTSKEFLCVRCNQRFKCEIDLDLHTNECKSKDKKEALICDLCGKKIINLELMRRHMVTHGFPMYKYICSYCSKPFKSQALKESHEKKHTQTKPFELNPLCGHRFRLNSSLVKHMRNHSGERPYTCLLCDKSYKTQNILKNYSLVHSSETPYTCQFCSKQFKTKDNLRNHEYIHKRPHVCPLCTCSFQSSYKLKKHQEMHEAGSLKYLCGVCPQMFSRPSYLWNHQKSKHDIDSEHSSVKKEDHEMLSYYLQDNVLKCSLCQSSVNKDLLEAHMQEHRDNGNQLTCPGCHKEYCKIEDFNFHTFTCSKLIPEADKYKCIECNEYCTSVEGLRNHMVTHGIFIRNYACSYCYKSFNYPSQKIKHENIHTNKKPFVCRDCSKGFHSKSALLSHLRLHTGERPFGCAICSKRFRSDILLQSHLNIHSPQGKFHCSSCPKVFKSKDNARLHRYTHTKPFSCPVCTKPFDSSFKVRKHLKMHTLGTLKYKCENCPQMFSRSSYCFKHMSFDHGITKIYEKETLSECVNTVCCIICAIKIPLDEYEEHLKNHCNDEKHSESS